MLFLVFSMLFQQVSAQDCTASKLPVENAGNSRIIELAPRYKEAIKACEQQDGSWFKGDGKKAIRTPTSYAPYFKGRGIDCVQELSNITSFIRSTYNITNGTAPDYQSASSTVSMAEPAQVVELRKKHKELNSEWGIVHAQYEDVRKQFIAASNASPVDQQKVSGLKTEVEKFESRRTEILKEMRSIEKEIETTLSTARGPIGSMLAKGLRDENVKPLFEKIMEHPSICYAQYVARKERDCPSVGSIEKPKFSCGVAATDGYKAILRMLKAVESGGTCGTRDSEIKAAFAGFKSSNLDDLVIMGYVAQNIEELVKNPTRLRLLGAALQAGEPVKERGSEDVAPSFSAMYDMNMMGPTIQLRMALINETKKAENLVLDDSTEYRDRLCKFEEGPVNKQVAELNSIFDNVDGSKSLCSRSSGQRQEILDLSLERLGDVLADPQKVAKKAKEFSEYCDHKVARIFGGDDAVASVCGHDHVGVSQTTNGSVTEEVSNSMKEGSERSHVFVNMHIYPNKLGSGKTSDQKFYVPAGANSATFGGLWNSQGSFNIGYSKLGRYRGVTLNINHLAKPVYGGKKTNIKNPRNVRSDGSFPVGEIGGEGGQSEGYKHSHVQIFNSAGHRLNFVDAFCRD